MRYRREIDGLRAVAVLPVIFFHAGVDFFSGGYVGVDVFFVISGYLITTIILTEKRAGTFTIGNFYERRARRILPALFFVMLACMPLALRDDSPYRNLCRRFGFLGLTQGHLHALKIFLVHGLIHTLILRTHQFKVSTLHGIPGPAALGLPG